ncbi:hypothetical protein BH09PSE3_BH09PSE3_24860 [soil metagenome]
MPALPNEEMAPALPCRGHPNYWTVTLTARRFLA